jgi:hypothetical protein
MTSTVASPATDVADVAAAAVAAAEAKICAAAAVAATRDSSKPKGKRSGAVAARKTPYCAIMGGVGGGLGTKAQRRRRLKELATPSFLKPVKPDTCLY